MTQHCCKEMAQAVTFSCETCADQFECTDSLVTYSPKFDEYGLIVHDGGHSFIEIKFCPWCGSDLPESKRGRWFDELEALGFDEPIEDDIPSAYKSEAWYQGDR